MSLPHASRPDDQQLVRYLLGLLPEDDVERLDEMSIADDEVAWRLRTVENDLVDAYLRGTLTGEMHERFESVYLASPRRRQKVEFAGGLLRAVDRASPPEVEAPSEAVPEPVTEQDASLPRGLSSIGQTVLRSRGAWMLSAAAALLLCASGALLVRNLQVVRELNESRRERTTLSQRVTDLEQQLKNQEAAHADVIDELERVRTLQPVVQQPVGIRPSDRPVGPALTTIALALLPMTRSAEAVTTLTIPPGTERVAFDLRLESNEFVLYRAALRDPATGLIAWRSNEVKAPPILESRSLPIVVPAGILKAQHYSIELSGRRRAGADEEMAASYAFKAVR
jgi:hypothetical protein